MDVVGRKYTMVKEKLKRVLAENTTKYSMTTDIWTSFANEAYISLTVHFIDDCWEMKSYTLATYSFPEQHTGDNIVEKLKEVVSEYQIDDNKIFAIVHDQGSNFQRTGRLLEDNKQWKSVNCAASLSTVVCYGRIQYQHYSTGFRCCKSSGQTLPP